MRKYEDISYPNKQKETERAEMARKYESQGKKVPKQFHKKPGAGARALLRGVNVGRVARTALKAKIGK